MQLDDSNTPAVSQNVYYELKITNNGATSVPLSQLTVRYWYTWEDTGSITQTFGPDGLQTLFASQSDLLMTNMAKQFLVYSTGRGTSFSDRDDIGRIVGQTNHAGGGMRTLIHEVVRSSLFKTR